MKIKRAFVAIEPHPGHGKAYHAMQLRGGVSWLWKVSLKQTARRLCDGFVMRATERKRAWTGHRARGETYGLANPIIRVRFFLVETGSIDVQLAIARYAPTFVSDEERSAMLVRALPLDELSGVLSLALDQVEAFHPPAIVDALFRGLLARPGDVACHFAAMLAFVFEKADSSFDWEFRPLFLRFNTDLHAERVDAFRELCALIGLDAVPLMASIRVVALPSA